MKKNVLNLFVGSLILLLTFSCSEEEVKYKTSVVRNLELFKSGEPWAVRPGISTRPLFIYGDDGAFVANYTSLHRFALENGSYRFVATDMPEQLITSPANLNDLVIEQFEDASQEVWISAAMEYSAPFDEGVQLNIESRTGTLRLLATDEKADNSYSVIRAVVTTKRSGYRVVDETYVSAETELIRSKSTTTGGVNYTDDFVLFQTENKENGVDVRLDLLTRDSAVVRTMELDGPFEIFPDSVLVVDFYLNGIPDAATENNRPGTGSELR
jgi:hypothetical protein